MGDQKKKMVGLAQLGKIKVIMCQKQRVNLADIFFPLPSQSPQPPPPSPSSLLPLPHQMNHQYYFSSIDTTTTKTSNYSD